MRRLRAARPGGDPTLGFVSRSERLQADLFFQDLMGLPARRSYAPRWSPPLPRPVETEAEYPIIEVFPESSVTVAEDFGATEAVPNGGRGRFRHEPLSGEPGDNVEARFNVDGATTAGSTVDVVVHLHGYGARRSDFLARKAAAAGVDLLDGSGSVRVRASRPTLVLVPRGRYGGSGSGWYWDTLPDAAALEALIAAGVSWLCTTVLRLPAGSTLNRGRLTLMAHSGGGAGLSGLLSRGVNPDEVVCFDSLYGGEGPVRRWMEARVASPQASSSGLRAYYTRCHAGAWSYRGNRWILQSTEVSARRLQHWIDQALGSGSARAGLAGRFRVELTSVGHNDIPARYSPLLLDDIAANVPGASAPPPVTQKPPCVANDDWLTREARRPGGDAPPSATPPAPAPKPTASAATPPSPSPAPKPPASTPPPPTAAAPTGAREAEDFEGEAVYAPPNARPYTPSGSAALFRTPPNPVAVDAATQWPETTADPDAASRAALRALGVNAAGVTGYDGPGLAALRPIASAFGEAALIELLRRLRYSPARLTRPPHSYDNEADLTRAFGRAVPRPVILSMRTLLAIPGHFRELARRAGTEPEAFALENLGWLLMQSLLDEVRTRSGFDFWLPSSPAFVTPFANPLPALSPQASALVTRRMLIDTTLGVGDYNARLEAWRSGPPGRLWRLETGRDTSSGRPAAAPFYPDPFTIPASINIATQRAQVQGAWTRRVAAFDAGTTTVPLTRCDNSPLTPLRLMTPISLGGLQLRGKFPSPRSAPMLTTLTGLAVIKPALEAAFKAVADAGWNDLLFETQGMGCFRGKKIPGNAAAARTMSEHSLGIAVDLNAFENTQNTTGSMDPRIAALFEAFRFRWGKVFSTPDPMHFEYAG